jgi:ribosomal protein L1
MKDEEIIENINTIYSEIIKILPRDKENIKNLEIKFTMSKPQKIKVR